MMRTSQDGSFVAGLHFLIICVCLQPVLEPNSNRRSITSFDGDYATKSAIAAPRTTRSPR